MALVKAVESNEQPFPFLDLPSELQCHIFRKVSVAELHKLKEVSKEVREMIARNWRHNFYHLPPKIQIRILTETQMQFSDFRRMKLVSKDMKYLIERDGQHLTQQSYSYFILAETPSGDYAISTVGMRTHSGISIDDFCRIFAHCSFIMMYIQRVNITSHLCERLQNLRRKNISVVELTFWYCKFIGIEMVDAIEKILNPTQSYRMCFVGDHVKKDFFSSSSVRKLESLAVLSASDFTDDDLLAATSAFLSIEECCLSEQALRNLLKELTESKRNIKSFDFRLRNEIDVGSLLRDLPNIEKTGEGYWLLRDVNGKVFFLTITPKCFVCETDPHAIFN